MLYRNLPSFIFRIPFLYLVPIPACRCSILAVFKNWLRIISACLGEFCSMYFTASSICSSQLSTIASGFISCLLSSVKSICRLLFHSSFQFFQSHCFALLYLLLAFFQH